MPARLPTVSPSEPHAKADRAQPQSVLRAIILGVVLLFPFTAWAAQNIAHITGTVVINAPQKQDSIMVELSGGICTICPPGAMPLTGSMAR